MGGFAEVLQSARESSRAPSAAAAVLDAGEVLWAGATGSADGLTAPATTDTQYRIGSITKTLTATEIVRLRDEGRLCLNDRIGSHLPEVAFGDVTIAQLLTHTSGLQAETPGSWWERNPGISWPELMAEGPTLALTPGTRFHYSNLGYAVLGRLIEQLRGCSWFDAISRGILAPLGMSRTTQRPRGAAATGLAVHPNDDRLLVEPEYDHGAMAPAGQLWSTVADLARWARFVAGDTGDVLSVDSLEQMRVPLAVPVRPGEPFSSAQGLGWHTDTDDDGRWYVGHGGSMPGFLAQLWTEPASGKAVVTLANTTSGFNAIDELWAALDGARPPATVATTAITGTNSVIGDDVATLLGDWYWGPAHFALTATADGFRLGDDSDNRWSRFVRDGDGWRGLDTYFTGEQLRVEPDGSLRLASFVLTRDPYPGGDWISRG